MKKQEIKSLILNKKVVSDLSKNEILGGFNTTNQNDSQSCFDDCPTFTGQTGSWCLTGNQTNCQ